MKTKNNKGIKRTFIFPAFVALTAALLGCGGGATGNNSAATPNVNRDTPANTQAQSTPTPDPVQAVYGAWETDNPDAIAASGTPPGATQQSFVRWTVNPGVKDQNGVYTGKITNPDQKNMDLANYKIGPQNTISLEFLPPAPAGSSTYSYEVSPDGNTLTLKTGNKPIILKRGTTNRDIQQDAQTIASKIWAPTPNTQTAISNKYNLYFDTAEFANAIPSGEGYGGAMELYQQTGSAGGRSLVKTGSYIITSKGKVTLDIGAGKTPANYSIKQNGDLLEISFPDNSEWVFNSK